MKQTFDRDVSRREKILIIDDDAALRKTLQDILKLKGYLATPCDNGAAALSAAREDTYCLTLIDLKLEDMPGLEVMRELKAISPEMECIILTGYASQSSAIEAINLGAYSYVQKPYDMDNLLVTIRRALERQKDHLDIQKRTHEISQLYEAGKQLGASLDLETIYNNIYQVVSNNMPSDGLVISAYERETELITCQRMWSDGIPLDISSFPAIPLNTEGKGTQSKVIISGEAVYLPDYLAEIKSSSAFYYVDKDGIREEGDIPDKEPLPQSALMVPITLDNQVVGVVQVFSYQPDDYTQDNLSFLQALAPQVAVATANADLYTQAQNEIGERMKAEAEIKRKADEFAALYDTSQTLASQQDLPGLMNAIVEHAARLLQAPSAYMYLFDPTNGDLVMKYGNGISPKRIGARRKIDQGMAGWVMREQKPLIVDDYSLWPGRDPEHLPDGFNSAINVPIRSGGEFIGVLGVQRKDAAIKFTQEDARLLSLFAAQAASAIHNTRLMEETKRQATQMSLLYDAGLGLNSIREPRAQLEYLFKIAMDSLGGDRAAFSRYSPYQDVIKFEFGIGYLPEVLSKLQKAEFLATDEGSLSGWVAVHRQPLNLPDLENEPHYKPTDPELKSALMAPVERDEQLLGILTVFSTQPYAFDSADERLLQLFANQAAVAMENAQLLSQTQHQLERIQALHDIDLAITASVSLKVTLKILLEQVLKRLEMDAAGILVYNPHSMELEPTTSLGFQTIGMYPAGNRNVSSRDWVSNRPLRLGESMAGKAALERQLVNIDDIDSHPGLSEREHLFSNHGFSSYFAIPLISKGELKGVMEVLHRTPFVPDKDWIAFLYTLGNQATIAIDNASMFDNLQRSNLELSLAYETTLEGWAKALEMRDMETEGHSQRVTDLTLRLGRAMDINETTLVHVRRGALLHDIGKMGIPDSILLKPAALSEEEWDIMKRHPVYAYELMAPIAYLRPSVDIPYCHHEKWDGSGYPRGLKGEQIPLAARVFAVVDVWDALLSDRPYRPVWQRQEVLEYIRAQSGSHFDPQVVEAFFKLID